MFLNSWSIALCTLSLLVVLLSLMAARTAFRVICYWDLSSDSNRQIRLENETWLASTLVQYALGFQIISLLLFVLAADQFSHVISGAMCATGSLTANSFGLPALGIKLVGLFLYGLWIVINQFDISSESYPLLKFKYVFLVCLLPLLFADTVLQTLYIAELKPDIITSCCAVVFGEGNGTSANLFGTGSQSLHMMLFYGVAVLLLFLNGLSQKFPNTLLMHIRSLLWIVFLITSFVVITTVFSSYVYAMPYHHCPFCIIKKEYHYIGILQYTTLLLAVFFGASISPVRLIVKSVDLQGLVKRYHSVTVIVSSILLVLFVVLISYHMVVYRFFGGES